MILKNLGLFVGAIFFSQILFAMEPILPGDDFSALAQAHNSQEYIKKLNRSIESYDRNIKKGIGVDKSYSLKAGALMELAVFKPDNALFSQALECLDAAISRQPYNAIYFVDRAKLHLKLGNKNLALQDIQKVKSIKISGVDGMYVSNTLEEVETMMKESSIQSPDKDFAEVAKESNKKDYIEKLENEISLYDISIGDDPKSGASYYQKATALVKLADLKSNDAHLSQALECFNTAIKFEPFNATYLIDRAKLNLKLALLDIKQAKSIKMSGIEGAYVSNSLREVETTMKSALNQQ